MVQEPVGSFRHSLRRALVLTKTEYIGGESSEGWNGVVAEPDESVWSTLDALYVASLAMIDGAERWTPNSSGGRLAKVCFTVSRLEYHYMGGIFN